MANAVDKPIGLVYVTDQLFPMPQQATVPSRDPERTRRRILAAALHEFCAHGFAGARVDAVARRARINKRMLYHYFGNKHGLFREVLRSKLAERVAWLAASPEDFTERLVFWFDLASQDPNWIRLLEWEALQTRPQGVVEAKKRRKVFAQMAAQMRESQGQGRLSRDFPAEQLVLAVLALIAFPLAFPQLTWLATGLSVDSPKFLSQCRNFLRWFGAALQTPRGKTSRPVGRTS